MTNQILSVEGMTCDHCAQSVKDAVNVLSGISRVEVDLENKSVTVEFDEAQTKIECIADKITEVGFDIKN